MMSAQEVWVVMPDSDLLTNCSTVSEVSWGPSGTFSLMSSIVFWASALSLSGFSVHDDRPSARAAGAPNPIAITVAVAISGAAFILRVSLQDRVIPIHHDAVITDRLDELLIVAIGGRWRCQTIPPVAMAVAAMVRNHRQHVARPVWPVATRISKLTARRLVIAFVPTTGLETGGLPSGGCGDSSAEREFPSDKVYGRDDLDCGVDRFVRFGVQDDVDVERHARGTGGSWFRNLRWQPARGTDRRRPALRPRLDCRRAQ